MVAVWKTRKDECNADDAMINEPYYDVDLAADFGKFKLCAGYVLGSTYVEPA